MKLTWSDVTPYATYLNRRNFIRAAASAVGATALPSSLLAAQDDKPNTFEEITNYNNFVELGYSKTDPAENAGLFNPSPWSVMIDGLVDKPGERSLDEIAPANAVEQRITRLRCVEAWSMVIPWVGVPLGPVLQRAGVQPSAKFVRFTSVMRPDEMPGQRRKLLNFPYVEGLRIDEAMHPLTFLATGLYDQPLPVQNGAPIRLVVPWKYGFKSSKSIVRITLTDQQPVSTWEAQQPSEYGFYANVNPEVDHPRWSQATERRIGAGLFGARQPTQMFNGYGDQVASLYAGMDLRANY